MENLFLIIIFGTTILIMGMLYRVLKGPSIYDRLNGLGVVGTNTILLLVLIGFVDKREDMFVDIAISYAMLGFISLLVIAKYISGKETE